jgi:hypothetical protein
LTKSAFCRKNPNAHRPVILFYKKDILSLSWM